MGDKVISVVLRPRFIIFFESLWGLDRSIRGIISVSVDSSVGINPGE